MKFEYWFPTVTAVHHINDELKMSINQKIDSWIEKEEHLKYLELCKEDDLYTSYFKWHDTIGDLNLEELRVEIKNVAALFTQHFGLRHINPENLKVDSWINFFKPGQSEMQHNHYGNFLSGVYYIKAPPNTGAYRFYDPAAQKVMWKGSYLKDSEKLFNTQTSADYHPQEGMMIMFPSWLEHCVLSNKSDQTRISLAFNVNVI